MVFTAEELAPEFTKVQEGLGKVRADVKQCALVRTMRGWGGLKWDECIWR